ncbi:MAG: class I SAM-dependent methyltransferase, partial [Bacteroidota bacterium]
TPEEMHHNLGVLKKFVPAHLSSHEVDERIERIKQKIQYISEARLTELLVEAGFQKPNRFYQLSIYGGWMVQKGS